MGKPKKFTTQEKSQEMKFDTTIRGMLSRFDPKDKSDKKAVLKPRNVNKNCVR